ncbi:phytanoyl-CoA dioxygenase family protein [Parvibaculum sp.]|uniref:phytanoyl-CoA dioxygenase family protein n=1 Tax=Parvibaculum sp. TaxID=2024848 RepID=UPI001D451845|nr:phytanoyl-CoA dioxygenase family protein [Parvibaculum sp.]MBX3490938.1 phytanoyl-CoA dioxygenase family protein [Parvibaculum sp.]MCW5728764.1 phytanoyl-CoA dioxygenase family protein [Parvibaculum sp.]
MRPTLASDGWEPVSVQGSLERCIEALFRDLCAYTLVIADDGKVATLPALERFRESLAEGTTAEIEPLFQGILLGLARENRKLLGKLYDLGTRPMKLLSGRALFFTPEIEKIIGDFFADGAHRPLLVSPYNGETLHVFPPGEENFRFNLPVHQDYPYLLQSSRQLTFWLNLTNNFGAKAGGVRVFPGTHRHGVARTFAGEHGHYEVATDSYPEFNPSVFQDSDGNLFDMYAVDSLTWHTSLRNETEDQVRITYIFRVSDIADGRVPFGMDRATGEARFEDLHAALYVAAPG